MDEAEPVPILTSSSDDESVDGGMTGSDADEMDATSDYGSGEQQPVSDRSEEDGEEDVSSASWETDEDGEEEDGDHGEGGEVMEDAFATRDSDEVREEGNALFKEKKYKEAVEKYKAAAAIGERCQIGLDSGWQGLIKAYCNIAHCLNQLGDFKEAERLCFKAMDLDCNFYKSYLRLSAALLGQDEKNLSAAICALCRGKELPDLHDKEIAAFTEELTKLGASGGVLTQAGRELNMKEVHKEGVQAHGPPLYTRPNSSSSFAFSFGWGSQPRQPGPAPKNLLSQKPTPGKKAKVTSGRSEEVPPGLSDESSESDNEVGREMPSSVEPKLSHCQGDREEEFQTGAKPKRRVMIPCGRKEMEMHFKASKGEEEKKRKVERSTAWAEYTAVRKLEEEDKARTERLLEKAKIEKDKRRRIEAKEVLKTATDQRGEKAEDDDLKHFEQVLEGDVAFAKGQMLRSRELHTKALSLAPQAWRSSIQCFATRYQLARSCIEMANPNSLAQGYKLLKEMEEECQDEKHCRAPYSNAVHFLSALLFKSVLRRAEALKQLQLARHKVKSCKPLCRASDGLPLPETEPDYLRKGVAMLLENLKYPEKPAAQCRHIGCIKLQEKQAEKPYLPLPATSIYLSNPSLVQYITVTCFGGCDINFHTACWEDLKSEELKSRSPRDKDFLGFPCPTPDCGGALIAITITGKDGEVEKQIKDSKIIEKLKGEKRDWKNAMKEERFAKEEAIKRQKLEEKVAQMRMKARSTKARFSTAGGKEIKGGQNEIDPILERRSSGNGEYKVDGKLGEELKKALQEDIVARSKQEEGAGRGHEDCGGDVFENMNKMETAKQEEVKEQMTNCEGEKRVAFLLALAQKLQAQLQVPKDGSLKGILDYGDGGVEVQDGRDFGKTMQEDKLGSAIKSNMQELERMASLEAKHLREHNIVISEMRQTLLKEMSQKSELELELAFVKSHVEKLQRGKSEVSNKMKEAELKQLRKELASQSRRIVECEQQLQQIERESAIQEEQQLKMRLEHEEAEGRWLEQMRAAQVKKLEESYVEVGNQLRSRRDTAESVLRQLVSIGNLSAVESSRSALEQLNVALATLEADFKEKMSSVGEVRPTDSCQLPVSALELQLSPPLRLLLSLPLALPPASALAPFGRQLKEDTPHDAAPVKKGRAGMLELLCSRIPNLTKSAAEHYFAEVKHRQGSLTGVPIEEIVKEVEALLNHDLGRTENNQEAPECSICLKSLIKVDDCITLECDHTFHTDCIEDWIEKKKGGSTCPICRSSLT